MKTDRILEFVSAGTGHQRINHAGGVVFDVKILGLVSRNNRLYPETTLKEAAPLYENAKVNLNHPERPANEVRKYQDRFGAIKNVRLLEGAGLFGDFYFNPKHPLAEQFLWDAEHSPENVGFSHNVEAVVSMKEGQQIVEKIEKVHSVDLVADPATTRGLFEQQEKKPAIETGNDTEEKNSDVSNNEVRHDVQEARTQREWEALEKKAAVLEQIVETLMEKPEPMLKVSRKFLSLLMEAENPKMAKELLAERLEAYTAGKISDPFAMGPMRIPTAETQISTGEFVRLIAR